MRTLISAVLLASAVVSTAVAQPVNRTANHLRTYDQCFALAEARGFSIANSSESGEQRRDKFIHDCEVGTQS